MEKNPYEISRQFVHMICRFGKAKKFSFFSSMKIEIIQWSGISRINNSVDKGLQTVTKNDKEIQCEV